MRIPSSLALIVIVLVGNAGATASAGPIADNLKCYEVTDSHDFEAAVQLLGRQFGDETKCNVRVSAAYYCVPVAAEVDSSNAPAAQVEGQELRDDRICYAISCPESGEAQREVTDRFGTRKIRRGQPSILCVPAVPDDAERVRRGRVAPAPVEPWYAPESAPAMQATRPAEAPPAEQPPVPKAAGHDCGTLLAVWGSAGERDAQFDAPAGITIDGAGYVYVADAGNHRIQKFTAAGLFVTAWGERGGRPGQFDTPWDVAADASGNVYVADTKRHRVQKFDSHGTFVLAWGTSGNGRGEFLAPYGIAVGPSGSVYVADTGNDRIEKFDGQGRFLAEWGGHGDGPGRFSGPYGIAVGGNGVVYVADRHNHRIQRFDADGGFLDSFPREDGRLDEPFSVAVDTGGNVYVADGRRDRIVKFDSTGAFVSEWGASGSARGMLDFPAGVAVSSDGRVYVSDRDNNRVAMYACP